MITEEKKAEIKSILNYYDIYTFTIQDDGSVDIDGKVDLSKKSLTKIPVKFGVVNGDFLCSDNKLKSLKGAPRIVMGNFDCGENKLTTLDGGPSTVSGNYWCDDNELETFYGLPKSMQNKFSGEDNFVDDEIIEYMNEATMEELNIFIKYQGYYGVFTETTFDLDAFHELLEDIKDGLE